jgi:hypothetical protein
MVFLGGQFKSEMGGQFESATHGQFKSAQGGQFDRILQEGNPSMNFPGIYSLSCGQSVIPVPSLPPFIRIVIMQKFFL